MKSTERDKSLRHDVKRLPRSLLRRSGSYISMDKGANKAHTNDWKYQETKL
jgi:hypothetical protein